MFRSPSLAPVIIEDPSLKLVLGVAPQIVQAVPGPQPARIPC